MSDMTWVKPGLWGAAAGAVVAVTLGFYLGGWVTGGSATEMTDAAVVAALAPVCVEQARIDPARPAKIAVITAANTRQRPAAVMEAGWATMPGKAEPDAAVAAACVAGLDLAAT
jgi:alpha/beta superfamily hydrolase